MNEKDEIFISERVAWQEEQTLGYVYVLDVEKNVYYKLQDIAREIWLEICDKKNSAQICGKIIEKYNLDEDTVKTDVSSFVQNLVLKDLILNYSRNSI